MSIKSRLFASVAAPLVSLPLMIQPAAAVPTAPGNVGASGDVIMVQETLILPPGAAPEEEEEQQQQEEAPAEVPAEETPAEPPPAEEAPAEAAPEPAPEVQQEAPAEIQPEAPAPEPEAAPEPEPEPEVAPEPEPEPEAAPQAEPEAAPEAPAEPEPAPEAEPLPQAEQPAEEAAPQQEEQPAEEGPAEETAPATDEAPATDVAPDEGQQAPAAEEQQPDATEAPASEAPAQTQDGATEGPADQPADATGEAPAQPDAAAPADGATEQTAPEGAAPQDGAAAQPVQQAAPQSPTTPEEVERARAIAEDPSQAPEGQPVVLPVENGAAVLDSQKESMTAPTTTTGAPAEAVPDQAPAPAQAPAQAEAVAPVAAPTSDAEAQAPMQGRGRVELRAATAEQGERIDGRPEFRRLDNWDYREGDRRGDRDRTDRRDRRDRYDDDSRVIISIDDRTVVRHDDSRRFYRDGGEVYYERLPGERYREVVDRDGGVQVVTIRNSYGVVVQRSRIVDGEEYVLYYAPDLYEEDEYVWRDPALDLPPMRLTIPLDEYIIDTSSDPDRDYYEFLEQPPVERVERVYSLDEVRYSARIRDKARRIDLDTIKFATGSAEIPMNQASSLKKVAEAMDKILQDNPAETFLIEGHTDAVGSDDSNLILSDERAESVAVVLTDAFGIPPENLTTQGYGERYLKVRTEAENQENRRVTIRRITPLVKPIASNQ